METRRAVDVKAETGRVLCDLALAGNDLAAARRFLDEATTRGADPAELAKREQRLADTPTDTAPSADTIIR